MPNAVSKLIDTTAKPAAGTHKVWLSSVDITEAAEIRAKYKHFRILVIGRANAGKTTLLKRVCNTTEDPCIYDETNKTLLEPTSGFIFHDSPGFETGDECQLHQVLSFIRNRAMATDVDRQLHAI
ncbi:hypothetical protein H0H92_009015, partial [Tricholoma furcatifolium]